MKKIFLLYFVTFCLVFNFNIFSEDEPTYAERLGWERKPCRYFSH